MSNKEISSSSEQQNSGNSEWDILSQDLQNEIAETVEEVNLETEEATAKAEAESSVGKDAENQDIAKSHNAEYYREHSDELGDMVQDLIRLRGGEKATKRGEWDKAQMAHIDENGMPTDYNHLMRYVKENPDAIETLTKEYDNRLKSEAEELSSQNEEYDAYMEKFANPFEGTAAEIAKETPRFADESWDDYEARINRAAKMVETAEKLPRLESDEGLTEAAQGKRVQFLSQFDLEKPIWGQMNSDQKKELRENYPRKEGEDINEWRAKVEKQLGVKVWENTAEATPAQPAATENHDTPTPPETNPTDDKGKAEATTDSPAPEASTTGATAKAENAVSAKGEDWYSMNRWERRVAAEKSRTEAIAKLNGQEQQPQAAAEVTPIAEATPAAAEPATAEATPAQTQTQAAEATPAAEAEPVADAEKDNTKVELGKEAQQIKNGLENLYNLRRTIIFGEAQIKADQEELDNLPKNSIFKPAIKKRRLELKKRIEEQKKAIADAQQKLPQLMAQFGKEFKNSKLSNKEMGTIRKFDFEESKYGFDALVHEADTKEQAINAELSKVGINWENQVHTMKLEERLAGAKKAYRNMSEGYELAKKNHDKMRMEWNGDSVVRQRHDITYLESLLEQKNAGKFSSILSEVAGKTAEQAKSPRDAYTDAVMKGRKLTEEVRAAMAKLPENQRADYKKKFETQMKENATAVEKAGRALNLELSSKCTSEELAAEWRDEISKASVPTSFYAYRFVAEIVPSIGGESINGAKRAYERIKDAGNRQIVEESLKKYFGADESFIAQLRGTDGENQQAAA